jgi:protein-disulfide isomerase-like protein with CxxC motif
MTTNDDRIAETMQRLEDLSQRGWTVVVVLGRSQAVRCHQDRDHRHPDEPVMAVDEFAKRGETWVDAATRALAEAKVQERRRHEGRQTDDTETTEDVCRELRAAGLDPERMQRRVRELRERVAAERRDATEGRR